MAGCDLVFSHITSFLNFDEAAAKRNIFVLAIKDTLSDLSFVYADFLFHYTKKDYPVIIVNLAQSFHHFNQIMLKSGINLKTLRESEKVISIDVLAEAESVIQTSALDTEKIQTLSSIILDSNDAHCLRPLYEAIQSGIETVAKSKPGRFLLIIDDLNVLINLGVPFAAIQLFVLSCYSSCSKSADLHGALLIGTHMDINDSETVKRVNYLSHICDIELKVEGLKTGFSRNTHGKISFEVREKSKGVSMHRKLFFKVEDKGAKFFTDGM